MQDLAKYVLGVAAKSNVSKRQVGCILVADNKVVSEGYNTEDVHAEAMACKNLVAEAKYNSKHDGPLIAYVTHHPCPECAKLLLAHEVTRVEVVEAFQKFDGDKLRIDLVDPDFALELMRIPTGTFELMNATNKELKQGLFELTKQLVKSEDNEAMFTLLAGLASYYTNYFDMERCLAEVLTFGARKYKANNWRQCEDTGRYLAAAHRHLNAFIAGELADPETGYSHLDHLLCNLMFLHVLGYKL